MRLSFLSLLALVSLGGCISYSGTSSPARETVVVPQGSTTVVPQGSSVILCANGMRPPC